MQSWDLIPQPGEEDKALNSLGISCHTQKKDQGNPATRPSGREGVGTQWYSFISSGQVCLVTRGLNPVQRLKDMSAVTEIEAKWEVQSPGSRVASFYRRCLWC